MPGFKVNETLFKDNDALKRLLCPSCDKLLREPVQPMCGHRICLSCTDSIIAGKDNPPVCPLPSCGEEYSIEDGAYYFPDRFVKREINGLEMVCENRRDGCFWEGKFAEYDSHLLVCEYSASECRFCSMKIASDDFEFHLKTCPSAENNCPLALLGCPMQKSVSPTELAEHIKESEVQHLSLFVKRIQGIEELLCNPMQLKKSRVESDGDADLGYHTLGEPQVISVNAFESRGFVDRDCSLQLHDKTRGGPSSLPQKGKFVAELEDPYSTRLSTHQVIQLVQNETEAMRTKLFATVTEKMQTKDEEITSLRAQVTKLEKQIRQKNAEFEDRDFRLSLIENSNHDGSMIWKIPQFSQRKADAENGKYTSIFSLPFYSGRYGYKMCLRLYIMGDGIGKGTHLSLFFVVMRGEFDNILQWPFTHKVTFKLINQAGGRDIVDSFQPDPMSSSFRKPRSDMNIASGCPRFVSHTELERGGFIVDDTVFIKCMIDTSTILHP